MDDFVHLPRRLYAGNPCYVPDLESDIRETFDPQKNAALEFSDIQAFMAYDEAGTPVGRIAGIINHRANEKWHTRNVRFGFIEFVDDLAVPAALLRAVEDWGRSRGMDTVVGPMGIFDFDKEGMLVEDFDQLGSSITIYNPPYYPRHLEALGYVKEVDWVQARIEVPAEVPARYARTAALAQEMYGLRVRKISVKEMLNGYGRKVFQLLNQAYAPLYGYTELMDRQIHWFGAGEEEYAQGKDTVAAIFRQFTGKVPKCTISEEEYQVLEMEPGNCLCTGRMWIQTDPTTGVYLRVHQRVTMGFRWVEGKPRCYHIHISKIHLNQSFHYHIPNICYIYLLFT